MNKEMRIEELKNAGFDINAFIAMGLPEGSKVTIDLPDQTIEVLLQKFEDMDAIKADPDYKRWTMALVFDVLRTGASMERYLKGNMSYMERYSKKHLQLNHAYRYQFTQTLERLREVEKKTGKEREILEKFFNPNVAISLARGYISDLRTYVDGLQTHKYRGRPYKKIPGFGHGVLIKDIEGMVFAPLERELDLMESSTRYFYTFIRRFEDFISKMVKFPDYNLPLNERFISAYQGRGAYFTTAGLIKFHGCRVYNHEVGRWCRGPKTTPMSRDESLAALKAKVDEIVSEARWHRNPEWYKLWGFMKEVIEDNNFDFYATMRKKYGK